MKNSIWLLAFLAMAGAPMLAAAKLTAQADVVMRFIHDSAMVGAVYGTFINETDKPLVLNGVKCDCAARSELHETRMEGNVAFMDAVSEFSIPAGGKLLLAPGAKHIMAMGTGEPKPGSNVSLTLLFANAEAQTIKVPVAIGPAPRQPAKKNKTVKPSAESKADAKKQESPAGAPQHEH